MAMSQEFQLTSPFQPAGDQPQAIKKLVAGVKAGKRNQTLLGVTGSGKTYTMASVIAKTQKPALIISHNKTLAAQLASEFGDFFPKNKVEYFVSYYDYYQPEAYIPRTDTYIAKDAAINDEIDRLRHSAMEAILTRDDVVVVASVSCIYGLGDPTDYMESRVTLSAKSKLSRTDLLAQLTRLQYTRNDMDLSRGRFRVRGDIIDIHPAGEDHIIRVEFFGNAIEKITALDSLTGHPLPATSYQPDPMYIFPATFFVTTAGKQGSAMNAIRAELKEQLKILHAQNLLVEAQRLEQRTTYDLEMMEHIGYVSGIENYSRHMDGRSAGQPPSTLIDYFRYRFGQNGFLTFIDESHMSVPQLSAMYGGDKARKESLIRYGFRLPSAKDNRPLQFHEFEDKIGQTVFVSATPSQYELNKSEAVVEQIVRPTGLLDPLIEIRPTTHQIDDVISTIQETIKKGQRVLVTTLTKRMAEELATYLVEIGIKSAYIHSDVDTLDRIDILRKLRQGHYDVLVGINLLREGLDLPEVALVAIMDADKEGYLRSSTALIQTMGRAARHLEGKVLMYADRITASMQKAIEETDRRRTIQEQYNKDNNITPQSIMKAISTHRLSGKDRGEEIAEINPDEIPPDEISRILKEVTSKMHLAAQNLEFERAARLRDQIRTLREIQQKSIPKKKFGE